MASDNTPTAEQVREIICPTCFALPGEYCVTMPGEKARKIINGIPQNHRERCRRRRADVAMKYSYLR